MVASICRGLPVERIVTHRFPLAEVARQVMKPALPSEAAFALFLSAECGKVLFTA